MLTLKNWDLLETIDGMVYANGTVFGHYRLQDGEFIHTSVIKKIYRCSEEKYVFETKSGNLYYLYKGDMNLQRMDITEERMKIPEVFAGKEMEQSLTLKTEIFEAKCLKLSKIINNPQAIARENMDEDGLYLIMEHMNVVNAVLRKRECFRELQPSVHVGMFQDSVLIIDRQNAEADFHYFPNHLMVPYYWSDGLANIYIHNIGNCSIIFKGTKENIECKSDKIVKIGKDAYFGEEVFSPEAVNGKCILSNELHGDVNKMEERTTFMSQEEINRLLS